jgi:hemolysin activation/secretion protein
MQDCEDPEAALLQQNSINVIPVTVALSYSTVKPDRWGGRTFLTSQSSFNVGATFGASDTEDLSLQRAQAKADYFIQRFEAARIQPLFGRIAGDDSQKRSQWILFLKADTQIANGALVPAEQKAIGGMDTVRGYPERDALGDNGLSGTMELRTPLFALPFAARISAPRTEDARKTPADGASYLQFVAFADAAHVSLNEPIEGDDSSHSLVGTGAGLRLGFSKYAQLKFDWGFPLKETGTSESGGRGHLSMQVQF